MTKFKIGDKVEIVRAEDFSSVNRKGDVGIVVEAHPGDTINVFRVKVEGRATVSNWEVAEDLKLIEDMQEFKVGDKVKVVEDGGTENVIGDIGTITDIDTDETYRISVEGRRDVGNWMYASMFKLVEEREGYWDLIDKKVEETNTIDLNAYTLGVLDGVKWQKDIVNKTSKSPTKLIENADLIIGNKYYLDSHKTTIGIYLGLEPNTNSILFYVKNNYAGYERNEDGYIDFPNLEGIYFYEVT